MELLTTPEIVTKYIADQNLGNVFGHDIVVSEQSGGFANFVYRISANGQDYYLKQRPPYVRSRPELPRVQEDVTDEIQAYRTLEPIMPEHAIPKLVHVDHSHYLFVVTAAQHQGATLNDRFLGMDYSDAKASLAGKLVADLHGRTLNSNLTIRGGEREAIFYKQQYQWLVREIPYQDETSRANAVQTVNELADSPKSLIWGDLSPKNIVVGSEAVSFVDLETVHRGDPAFDLGYITGHILLEGLKSERLDEALGFTHTLRAQYADRLSQYADDTFIAQTARDAILFAGTSMIHRTLASLVPEASEQRPFVTDSILQFATTLINQEVVWSS